MKVWISLPLSLLLWVPLVRASSLLKYQSGSAYCTGNLTNLVFVSATCPDEGEFGCTWGSNVSYFLQLNATTDFPYLTRVTVSPSIPRLPSTAIQATYNGTDYISNSCGSILNPPAGADAGYSCPDAGIYNARGTFTMFGNTSAWYKSYYGFNVGLSVRLYDAVTNDVYAVCYAEIGAYQGKENPSTDWSVLGGAGLVSVLLASGYVYRKRKIVGATTRAMDDSNHGEEETVTNFELVADSLYRV